LKPLDENQKFPNSKNISGRIIELFRNGANFEDEISLPRPLNHFFDPKSGYGLAIPNARPSPDWALEDKGDVTDVSGAAQEFSYKEGRKYFLDALTKATENDRNKHFGLTFQTLGMVIHHIQDMAQPQHVRNDDHCKDNLCRIVFRHYPSLYEKFTDDVEVRPKLPFTGYAPVYSSAETLAFNTPRKFWIGEGKGMAEFTNRNFVSARTNFRSTLTGILPSAEYAEPAPHQGMAFITPADAFMELGEAYPSEVKEFCGEGETCKIGFVQSTVNDAFRGTSVLNERAASLSIFDEDIKRRGLEVDVSEGAQRYRTDRIFSLNRLNYRKAHEFLIPRAVGYSAGLINYFFRGKMDFIPDPDNAGKYMIKNLGPEDMKGTFTLYYDDKDGKRYPTGNKWDLEIGANQSNNNLILKPNSEDLPEALVPGKYMLVFNGTMGEESKGSGMSSTGAVAAKQFEDPVKIKFTQGLYWTIPTDQRNPDPLYGFDARIKSDQSVIDALLASENNVSVHYKGSHTGDQIIPCRSFGAESAAVWCYNFKDPSVNIQFDSAGRLSPDGGYLLWDAFTDSSARMTFYIDDAVLFSVSIVPQTPTKEPRRNKFVNF